MKSKKTKALFLSLVVAISIVLTPIIASAAISINQNYVGWYRHNNSLSTNGTMHMLTTNTTLNHFLHGGNPGYEMFATNPTGSTMAPASANGFVAGYNSHYKNAPGGGIININEGQVVISIPKNNIVIEGGFLWFPLRVHLTYNGRTYTGPH